MQIPHANNSDLPPPIGSAENIALAFYRPDIPQNLGAALRLSACLSTALHVIEPCGFPLDDKRMRRAGMDYVELALLQRHASFEAFEANRRQQKQRLLLLSTKGTKHYLNWQFQGGDILLLGQESAGVPTEIHAVADATLTIPLAPAARSLNVVVAATLVLGEALRQTRSRSLHF